MSPVAKIHSSENLPLNLSGAFIRRTRLDRAVLVNANLTRADMTGASIRNADLKGARLKNAILNGADLTGATNLTLEQLAEAVIDDDTKLPEYIDRAELSRWKLTHARKPL